MKNICLHAAIVRILLRFRFSQLTDLATHERARRNVARISATVRDIRVLCILRAILLCDIDFTGAVATHFRSKYPF